MSIAEYDSEIPASPRELQKGRTIESPSDARRRTTVSAWSALRYIDPILIGTIITLTLFGLWALYGTVHESSVLHRMADRQVTWFGISLIGFAFVLLVDYRWLVKIAPAAYALNLVLLVVVLALGTRWLRIGPLGFQPAEPMKVLTVLMLAQWFASRPEGVQRFRDLIVPGLLAGVPFCLVMKQPDLGTGLLFIVIMLGMLFWAGTRPRIFAALFATGAVLAASAWPFLRNYQKERILTFLNPERDPLGSGYNVIQSLIATGNGGLVGRGWGEGTQAAHRYLPEAHNDFIFASLVEQTGLVGAFALFLLYGLLFWRLMHGMSVARDRLGGLIIAGLGAILFGHIVINVGMNIGLLPVTGLPLPFISYGGTFLLSMYLVAGLALSISMRRFVFNR